MSKKALTILLIFFVCIIYVNAKGKTPQLFNLTWGLSLQDVNNAVMENNIAISGLTHHEVYKFKDELDDLRESSYIVYSTIGTPFYNIPAEILFTFYNPIQSKENLQLTKIEVKLARKMNNYLVDAKSVFNNLVEAFFKNYNIDATYIDDEKVYKEFKYEDSINGINVKIIANLGDNILDNDISIIISYEEQILGELIAQNDKRANLNKLQNNISLRLIGDIYGTPVMYVPYEQSIGNALGSMVMFGVRIFDFTFGGAFRYNYVSFDGQNTNIGFKGGWTITKWEFHFLYNPLKWLEIHAGIGGGWLATAYDYKTKGTEEKDIGGISLFTSVNMTPLRYLTVKVPLMLDLFFSSTDLYPYFYGGLRAEFHPYFTWIGAYIEIGGKVWTYHGSFFDKVSGYFIWSLGASVNIDFKKIANEFRVLDRKYKAKQLGKREKAEALEEFETEVKEEEIVEEAE